jgi:hypothetical protein
MPISARVPHEWYPTSVQNQAIFMQSINVVTARTERSVARKYLDVPSIANATAGMSPLIQVVKSAGL